MSHSKKLGSLTETLSKAKDIDVLRSGFDELSDELYTVVKMFGLSSEQPVYRYLCPMANNNKGAYWLQESEQTENPYFGSKMFKCGSRVETVSTCRVKTHQEN